MAPSVLPHVNQGTSSTYIAGTCVHGRDDLLASWRVTLGWFCCGKKRRCQSAWQSYSRHKLGFASDAWKKKTIFFRDLPMVQSTKNHLKHIQVRIQSFLEGHPTCLVVIVTKRSFGVLKTIPQKTLRSSIAELPEIAFLDVFNMFYIPCKSKTIKLKYNSPQLWLMIFLTWSLLMGLKLSPKYSSPRVPSQPLFLVFFLQRPLLY